MAPGLPLKGMRRTLSIMKRPRHTPFDEKGDSTNQDGRGTISKTPTQQTGGQNQGVETRTLEHQTTARQGSTSCANSEGRLRALSALYRSELEDSRDDTNIATEEEVECINEQLPECFCLRCYGDCRNCLKKEEVYDGGDVGLT
ncbi:hypothetical protein BDV32DRAFT_144040 [Aspergillus pseudonomiae]|uniref:Uncharacterized protein n=1 Tax=Aspergillus pseudonomiae TaxID=1506151 RepID=A0A5N6IKC4_9EURO|nr:uncharacterized protein BDV37DRAFT_282768 [Aspergillus pseudonomiae]KAB8266319.1 hypothetical protein BDV32DRAFT_144040 [Aspergillus pseudonomiae]KAE8404474.1 hypothetical protein BDV37DRAFT_282768 [Aspergillus pseudonomiae]